jgi:hypothetical protein
MFGPMNARTALVLLAALDLGLSARPLGPQGASPQSAAPTPAAGVAPTVRVLNPPDYWGSYAIWGATGTDHHGHLWFGMTSNDPKSGSAHLYEYDPTADTFTDRGNVVAELTRLGLRRPGETQMKIHSRIVEAPDGYQYFASMDETGEADDGSKLPTWGGHLWRRSPTGTWEHLAATREALIAVAVGGPYVYAEGYFNQVLYQFDTRTKKIRSVTVGAVGGHVSRNFFADDRGHAFVSRSTRTGDRPPEAFLVEYDPALQEIAAQPLPDYFDTGPDDSHGIVAIHSDGQGGWFFATSKGRLFHEQPAASGPSVVTNLGWYSPSGPRYVASMFFDLQARVLYGVAMPSGNGTDHFEWIARPIDRAGTVSVLPYGATPVFPHPGVLYGSISRDAAGRFYVVGTMAYKPVILQITSLR